MAGQSSVVPKPRSTVAIFGIMSVCLEFFSSFQTKKVLSIKILSLKWGCAQILVQVQLNPLRNTAGKKKCTLKSQHFCWWPSIQKCQTLPKKKWYPKTMHKNKSCLLTRQFLLWGAFQKSQHRAATFSQKNSGDGRELLFHCPTQYMQLHSSCWRNTSLIIMPRNSARDLQYIKPQCILQY